jgi:hypothetical protein
MRRTENKVNGEVLLGLKDENLKSGIGIEAYGPRLKIMNAINDLFPGGECEYQVASTAADFFHSLPLTYHSQYLPSCRLASLPFPSGFCRERCLPGVLVARAAHRAVY